MSAPATAAAFWTDFDPTSQDFWEDPVAYLQPAHPDVPVFFWEEANTWVIAGFEEAQAAMKDFETFSSQQTMAGKQVTSATGALAEHQRIVDSILTNQLLLTDPPQHTARRKLQQKGFKRPRIEALQPFIQEHADNLIDSFIEDGSADIMQQFSYLFSIGVIGRVLGVYPTDLPKLREGIEAFSMLRGAATGDARSVERVADEVAKAFETVAGPYWYFEKWVEGRTPSEEEDIAADLAAARTPEGEPTLTSGQIVSYMVGLVVAGTDTTANLIGNIVRYLTEQPEAREEILAEPELWDAAIEEGLRRSANTPSAFRATTKDVEIGGETIPAGSKVMVSIAGANGDSEKFPDPLRFDVSRDNVADHLGFGVGRHFCLGAPLARSEARIALETLYRRLPGLRVDLDEPQEFMRLAVPRIRMKQTITWDD
jgi:cytochrome P450